MDAGTEIQAKRTAMKEEKRPWHLYLICVQDYKTKNITSQALIKAYDASGAILKYTGDHPGHNESYGIVNVINFDE